MGVEDRQLRADGRRAALRRHRQGHLLPRGSGDLLTTGAPPTDGAVLVVGAGLAGLFLALKLQPRPCVVLSPAPLGAGAASAWAQGGIAAALAVDDSAALHAADTVEAGAGLVDRTIARLVTDEGPARIRDLLSLGVPFDRNDAGDLSLSREAAHSRARVARVAGDLAGHAIMETLSAAARAAPHITIVEGARAVALAQDETGAAAGVLCRRADGAQTLFEASEIVLAAGGAGGLWPVTTNPASALGEGFVLGARSGALVADPEFVQFHPTAIDIGRDPAPLATEALRGEGAILVDRDGAPFMARHHKDADLAPRDIVARAIHRERRAGRGAYLDARAAIGAAFPRHFPTVFAACEAAGIDPRVALIPVAPAAHYHMGGLVTDLWGKTTVDGLSAVGECASTGMHGANRLASNSLLESVVFAHRIAERLREGAAPARKIAAAPAPPPETPPEARAALRAAMGAHVGVERTAEDRAAALEKIQALIARHGATSDLAAAAFIAWGAAQRLESRGAHFCPDHPEPDDPPRRTFLTWRDVPLLSGPA